MGGMTKPEELVMLALDKLGCEYIWYKGVEYKSPDGELCVVCGLGNIDFVVNEKPYHIECMS